MKRLRRFCRDVRGITLILTAFAGYLFPFAGFIGGAYLGDWLSSNWSSYWAKLAFSAALGGGLGWVLGFVGFMWYFVFASWEVKLSQENEY